MQDENKIDPSNSDAAVSTVAKKKGRETSSRSRIRQGSPFTFELSRQALLVFNQIMDMTEDEPNDIIRKAISLYMVALEAHNEGKAVGFASTPDAFETEFVGF